MPAGEGDAREGATDEGAEEDVAGGAVDEDAAEDALNKLFRRSQL